VFFDLWPFAFAVLWLGLGFGALAVSYCDRRSPGLVIVYALLIGTALEVFISTYIGLFELFSVSYRPIMEVLFGFEGWLCFFLFRSKRVRPWNSAWPPALVIPLCLAALYFVPPPAARLTDQCSVAGKNSATASVLMTGKIGLPPTPRELRSVGLLFGDLFFPSGLTAKIYKGQFKLTSMPGYPSVLAVARAMGGLRGSFYLNQLLGVLFLVGVFVAIREFRGSLLLAVVGTVAVAVIPAFVSSAQNTVPVLLLANCLLLFVLCLGVESPVHRIFAAIALLAACLIKLELLLLFFAFGTFLVLPGKGRRPVLWNLGVLLGYAAVVATVFCLRGEYVAEQVREVLGHVSIIKVGSGSTTEIFAWTFLLNSFAVSVLSLFRKAGDLRTNGWQAIPLLMLAWGISWPPSITSELEEVTELEDQAESISSNALYICREEAGCESWALALSAYLPIRTIYLSEGTNPRKEKFLADMRAKQSPPVIVFPHSQHPEPACVAQPDRLFSVIGPN